MPFSERPPVGETSEFEETSPSADRRRRRWALVRLAGGATLMWAAAIVGNAPNVFQFSLVQTHYEKPLGPWRYVGLVVFLIGTSVAVSSALLSKAGGMGRRRPLYRRLIGPGAALLGLAGLGALLTFHRGDERTLDISIVNAPAWSRAGKLAVVTRGMRVGWGSDEGAARWMGYYDNILIPIYPNLSGTTRPLTGDVSIPLPGPTFGLLKTEPTGYAAYLELPSSNIGKRRYAVESVECGAGPVAVGENQPKVARDVIKVAALGDKPASTCFGRPLTLDFEGALP